MGCGYSVGVRQYGVATWRGKKDIVSGDGNIHFFPISDFEIHDNIELFENEYIRVKNPFPVDGEKTEKNIEGSVCLISTKRQTDRNSSINF